MGTDEPRYKKGLMGSITRINRARKKSRTGRILLHSIRGFGHYRCTGRQHQHLRPRIPCWRVFFFFPNRTSRSSSPTSRSYWQYNRDLGPDRSGRNFTNIGLLSSNGNYKGDNYSPDLHLAMNSLSAVFHSSTVS